MKISLSTHYYGKNTYFFQKELIKLGELFQSRINGRLIVRQILLSSTYIKNSTNVFKYPAYLKMEIWMYCLLDTSKNKC